MLITDGAMEDFQSVFEEFNWPDKKVTHNLLALQGMEGITYDVLNLHTALLNCWRTFWKNVLFIAHFSFMNRL